MRYDPVSDAPFATYPLFAAWISAKLKSSWLVEVVPPRPILLVSNGIDFVVSLVPGSIFPISTIIPSKTALDVEWTCTSAVLVSS